MIYNVDYMIFVTLLVYIFYVIKFAFLPFPVDREYIQSAIERNNSYGEFAIKHNYKIGVDFSDRTHIKNLIFLIPAVLYLMHYRKNVPLSLFLITLSIESLQLLISYIIGYPYRTFDVNDFITNIGGGMVFYTFILIFINYNVLNIKKIIT